MTALIIATGNRHKLGEIAAILGNRYRFLTLHDFPEARAAVEDQPTFAANAMKKARDLARWMQGVGGLDFRIPSANALVLADDSGLEVDALKGAPGVHSARFAALDGRAATAATTNSADASNNAKLLELLKEVPEGKRQARFRCALASIRVKPPQSVLAGQTFEGTCEGRIQSVARGQGGFGYDSLFVPLGYNQSFAELSASVKNRSSHRAKALEGLKQHFASTARRGR